MSNAIFVSINAEATRKILSEEKNHEFRNYIPKQKFDFLFVYVTLPVSKLKYIIEINKIIQYPNKIEYVGNGNDLFNNGMKTKYAYEIKRVYKLDNPIALKDLKEKFKFNPPQSFAYASCYEGLANYIKTANKELVWSNKHTL